MAIALLLSTLDKEWSTAGKDKDQEDLTEIVDCSERIKSFLFCENVLRKARIEEEFFDLDLLSNVLQEESGAVLIQFCGYRHVYFLAFVGKDGEMELEPDLYQIGRDAPYSRAYAIARGVKAIKREMSSLINRDELRSLDTRNESQERSMVEQYDPVIKTELANLWDRLFGDLPEQITGVARNYIISDLVYGASIPYACLRKPIEKGGGERRPWMATTVIGEHFSVEFFLDLYKKEKDYPFGEIADKQLVQVLSYDSIEENSRHRAYMRSVRDLLYAEKGKGSNSENSSFSRLGKRKTTMISNSIDTEEKKYRVLKKISEAKILIFLGHIRDENGEPAFFLFHKGKNGPFYISRFDLQKLDLSEVRVCMLLACRGGDGRASTGNLPKSLSTTLMQRGVQNLVYATELLIERTAYTYALEFCKALAAGARIGRAHTAGLHRLWQQRKSDPLLGHECQYGIIRLVGNQMNRFG